MSPKGRSQFSTLSEGEKKSRLWQLAQGKAVCTLWTRGAGERKSFRIKDYQRETQTMEFHFEPSAMSERQDVLGAFELNGVSYFFKGQISQLNADVVAIAIRGDLFKSERRQNYRLLAYPIYDIQATFLLPVNYQGGKVVDIRKKIGHTALFKSFLRLVEPRREEGRTDELRIRVQDLSPSGMSIFIGELELEWFRAGEALEPVKLELAGEAIELSSCRIVYVVDHIGPSQHHKKYKVGLRFEGLTAEQDKWINSKIAQLLSEIDANKDFEDFSR